ncbi:unnamed protein product [Vicia faba]|uniref:Tryptophan synthase beta chain-like PALP domain-containing protein n=1 Tax=Vicia faba TaxID=3906 RepID=A0AAV1ACL7_VICFA|nr:unnamed protein product [Vicia faba]
MNPRSKPDSTTVLSSYPDYGGLVKKAYDLLESTPDAFMLQQFSNPAITQVHFETTGPEIWEDTNGQVDIFVMGIGRGGTVSGVGQYLKSRNPNVKIYGVEPSESNVLNGGKPGPHHITGNGVGFKPDILDMDVMDKVLEVSSEDAVNMARTLALKEGLMQCINEDVEKDDINDEIQEDDINDKIQEDDLNDKIPEDDVDDEFQEDDIDLDDEFQEEDIDGEFQEDDVDEEFMEDDISNEFQEDDLDALLLEDKLE